MRTRKILTVCLSVVFVLLLCLSVALSALAAACTPKAVERRLAREGIYTFATQCIRTEIEHLESVIGIPTADILTTIPEQTVQELLQPYVLETAAQLLRGAEAPAPVTFRSDALQALVNTTISVEQYGDNTAQMEEDRAAAYADLTTAVEDTLTFFPSTLFDTAMDILASKETVDTVYGTLHLLRNLILPTVLLTLLCGGAIVFLGKDRFYHALKHLGGCWSITGAVLFFCSLFAFCGNHLLDKFSLSDGLLRRFVLALFRNAASGILTATAVCFALGILLLGTAIAVIAIKTPCTDAETVVK